MRTPHLSGFDQLDELAAEALRLAQQIKDAVDELRRQDERGEEE